MDKKKLSRLATKGTGTKIKVKGTRDFGICNSMVPMGICHKIIQAKKFLKDDWLKRVVFQRNLKYLSLDVSFPWQPTRSCFDFENMRKVFLNYECECRLLEFHRSVHISQ